MEFWQLPGPAAFARAIEDAVADGYNLIVASPAPMGPIVARMIESADGWGLGRLRTCTASGGLPIDDLFDAWDIDERLPSKRTLASFIAARTEGGRVIVSGIAPEAVAGWAAFMVEYESASRAVGKFDRMQIIVLLNGVPKATLPHAAPALQVMVWDGWVGEADVLGYVAEVWRDQTRSVDAFSRLSARIVIRLALWDLDLVDRLLALSPADLMAPRPTLAAWAAEAGMVLEGTWEAGGVCQFDGEELTHSLTLSARGDPEDELSMRLWAAQAAELLPMLEVRRRRLVERMQEHAQSLQMFLDGEAVTDLDDIELGGLTHLARVHRFPRPIVDEAERLRWLRNRLAHQCPVRLDELRVLFDQIR